MFGRSFADVVVGRVKSLSERQQLVSIVCFSRSLRVWSGSRNLLLFFPRASFWLQTHMKANLAFGGRFCDEESRLVCSAYANSWKLLYALLSMLFRKRTQKRDAKLKRSLIERLTEMAQKCADLKLASAALRALSTVRHATYYFDTLLSLPRERCDPDLAPLWRENMAIRSGLGLGSGEWLKRATILAKFGDASMISYVVRMELIADDQPYTDDLVMTQPTFRFFSAAGPDIAFSALMREVQDKSFLDSMANGSVEDRLVLLASSPSTEASPELRRACIFLLHILKGWSWIIDGCLGLEGEGVAELVVRVLNAATLERKVEMLAVHAGNAALSPKVRLDAARCLLDLPGADRNRIFDALKTVPNFPLPWTHVTPISQQLRDDILRFYAPQVARSRSHQALIVEAGLLEPSSFKNKFEALIPSAESKIPPSQVIDGLEVLGPISAGWLHQRGFGQYCVFKIFTDPKTISFPFAQKGPRCCARTGFLLRRC